MIFTRDDIVLTTTAGLEGTRIVKYFGVLSGESVMGMNFYKDWLAGLTNFFGGRSGAYEGGAKDARYESFSHIIDQAEKLGANAVVGIHMDYEVITDDKGKCMMMVVVYGTAVHYRELDDMPAGKLGAGGGQG